MVEAAQYFPRGNNNGLPWPTRSFMVSESHKVLFSPIAKCACTSLKTMMVHLAQVEQAERILKLGVHRVTDKFNTGMHLKDLPKKRALDIRNSTQYYKFAVIRDPIKRAISAYTEKFVVNRLVKANHLHTKKVVKSVQGKENPDLDLGITFRQFVEFVTSQEQATLDPHWIPQCFYLRGVLKHDAIYRVDQLDKLKAKLESWTGVEIKLGQLNTSTLPPDSNIATTSYTGIAVDMLPTQLEEMGELYPEMFMEDELVEVLRHFYQQDYKLYLSTF